MFNWTDVIIAALLLAAGGPTIVRGLRDWWRAERELARRVTGQDEVQW